MAIHYSFFDSVIVNGVPDRAMKAEDLVRYFRSMIKDGVRANPSTSLQVLQDTNMRVKVAPGVGFIKGRILENDSDLYLQLDNADGVLKRIDRIVLRLDYTNRLMELVIKKGSYSGTPIAPTLQRDTDKYELALADILVNNGVTSITQANITDTRMNSDLCGYVTGMFQQLDTTTIFNQMLAALADKEQAYNANFLTWSAQKRVEFDDWFTTIQDILDENVAATLHNEIISLRQYADDNIVYLNGVLEEKATSTEYTAILTASNWTLNTGSYRQTLMVPGINASDKPIIGVTYPNDTATVNATIKREWSKVGKAVTGANSITFYCFGTQPTSNLTVNIKVVR